MLRSEIHNKQLKITIPRMYSDKQAFIVTHIDFHLMHSFNNSDSGFKWLTRILSTDYMKHASPFYIGVYQIFLLAVFKTSTHNLCLSKDKKNMIFI